jgi:predicted nucleic acid-binding protein
MSVVSNSSPLIALEQIGRLDLLQVLFGEILIPEAVAAEVSAAVQPRLWMRKQPILQPILPQARLASLGAGEQEAISLAVQVKASALILDDDPARKTASGLQLRVIGTAGVLVIAKERSLIGSVKPCLDALIAHRFFLSRAIYELILDRAGESEGKQK